MSDNQRDSIPAEKAVMRKLMIQQRAALVRDEADSAGPGRAEKVARLGADCLMSILKSIFNIPNIESPVVVSGYWPMAGELDPRPLLQQMVARGCISALPVVSAPNSPLIFRKWTEGDVLVPNPSFKTIEVLEPAEDKPVLQPQIMLTPLLAFDPAGYRLGFGGGYYDRTIQLARQTISPFVAVGIACEFQRRESVPHDRHDERLDWVITEETAMKTVVAV